MCRVRVFRCPNTAFVRELASEMLREPRDHLAAAAALLFFAQTERGYGLVDRAALLPDDDRLANAICYARDHFRVRVSTRELAKAAGMSTRAFQRRFRAIFGVTPTGFARSFNVTPSAARG
jgi:transcriptional regulator GlxA family with amidase domain